MIGVGREPASDVTTNGALVTGRSHFVRTAGVPLPRPSGMSGASRHHRPSPERTILVGCYAAVMRVQGLGRITLAKPP